MVLPLCSRYFLLHPQFGTCQFPHSSVPFFPMDKHRRPALLLKPSWAALSTKSELFSLVSCSSQAVALSEVTEGYAPCQGYPGDLGFCYNQPLGGDKQVILDIERVETQKVLECIAAVSTAEVFISSSFSNALAPGNSHPKGCVTYSDFLCIRWGYVPEH